MEPRVWTAADRATYYRQKANEAAGLAAISPVHSLRLSFEALAAKWNEMASTLERDIDPDQD